MKVLQSILAGSAALALLAAPVVAADSAGTKPAPDASTNATSPDAGSSDGASSGTSSSGNMQDSGVGKPEPNASRSTNSDGSPGKNTSGPDTGPRK